MDLELKQNGGEWSPVGGLELISLVQTVASQSVGSLRFSYSPGVADPFRFDTGDVILMRGRDGAADAWTTLFSGAVSASPDRTFAAGKAVDSVVAGDAWDELARTAYQVDTFTAASFNKSHVILFRDAAGDRRTTGGQAKVVLDYAISKGVAIQYVAADLTAMTVKPPADEQTDLSCAEGVLKCMRWQLDTFSEFDYSTTPPTIRFRNESAEQTRLLSVSDVVAVAGVPSIKRNNDKALRGVVINYEIENQIVDGTTQEIQTDSFGATSGPNVLIHTVSIDGSYVANEESMISVTCASWPSDWATNLALVHSLFPNDAAYQCAILGSGSSSAPAGNYVISGYQPGYNISPYSSDVWWDVRERWFWDFPQGIRYACDANIGNWVDRTIRYSSSLLFTDSPTGNYTKSTPIVVPGESIPSGVAQAIFNARSQPLYSGMLPQQIRTFSDLTSPIHNISLQGSLGEFETMRAPVQIVTRNWFSEVEQIKFGYPAQAGASDFVDLLRANRTVNRPLRRTWKT